MGPEPGEEPAGGDEGKEGVRAARTLSRLGNWRRGGAGKSTEVHEGQAGAHAGWSSSNVMDLCWSQSAVLNRV